MQNTSAFATLLLAAPVAAPVADDNSISAVKDFFARYDTM